MSKVSKKREKRSRSSTEGNTSFVQHVTSRMSNLLPATITRWLSSSVKSSPATDATDSSSEDETPDNPVVIQPPAKRMRYNQPEFNHFNSSDITCVNSSVDTVDTKYSSSNNTHEMSNSKIFFHSNSGQSYTPKRKCIFQSSIHESSKSSRAKSTNKVENKSKTSNSQPILSCSPFYPGQTMYGGAASTYVNQANIRQRKVALVNESKSKDNTGMSHCARRVLDLLENTSTPLMEARRIADYITGNNNSTLDKSTQSTSRYNCAPYPSKAVSYKMQELHVPNIASIMQLKQRSRLMSTTNAARQIIASHSSSSPVQQQSQDTQREQAGEETRDRFVTKIKSRLNGARHATKEQEHSYVTPLNLPTGVLQIGKDNMPTFTFSPTDSTNTPSRINNTTLIVPPAKGMSLKQNQISTQKESERSEFNIKEPVLRKSAPQPATRKSDLNAPLTPALNDQQYFRNKIIDSVMVDPGSTSNKHTNNDSYQFSSPVRISDEKSLSTHLPAKFTFGSPERSIDKKNMIGKTDNTSVCLPEDWRCAGCLILNKTDVNKCVSCGAKQSSKNTTKESLCSICMLNDSQTGKDKCKSCEVPRINSDSAITWTCQDCWVKNKQDVEKCVCCGGSNSNKFLAAVNSSSVIKSAGSASTKTDWKCNNCWITNNINVEQCVACGEIKPEIKENESTLTKNTSVVNDCNNTFGIMKNIMKLQSDKWKCPSCLLANESNKSKCVCCDFQKPGTVQESTNMKNIINLQSDKWECPSCLIKNENNILKCVCCQCDKPSTAKSTSNLKNVFKAQSDKWECPSCLVRNENNRSKCICCEFEKPGTANESNKLSFNFGTNMSTKFKFGIDSKTQDAGILKKPDVQETNNNVVPKTMTFTFGIPANKDENKSDTTKETEVNKSPKMNFTFGIPSTPAATESVITPIFVSSNKLSNSTINKGIEIKEKPQEVPTIEFRLPKPKDTPKIQPAIFGSELNVLGNKNISIAETIANLKPTVSINVKETANTSSNQMIMQPPVVNAQVTQPHNVFALSSSGLKSPVNLFATPAATTLSFPNTAQTSAASTNTAFFKKPETTSSLFQKNETTTTPKVSLFQKPDTVTNAKSAAISATTPPFFSFGNNGPKSTAPQPEKPKFNFTFGGINPMFTNTFSASNDVNTNKFDISGNSLNTGNGGLVASSALGGNGLTAPKLGSNDLPANHSSGIDSQAGSGLFVTPVQKENLWLTATSNSSNSFVSTSSSSLPKPATFTFGSSTPFNSNPTAFGGNQTPAQNMFGMNQSSNSQSSMFSNQVHNQTAPCLFGNTQPASNPTPAIGMFGSSSVGATPSFGTPRPAFEASSITSAATPAFSFGASQQNGVFGLVQQQPQPQQGQQTGMYNFAVQPGGAPQFNIGSAPNTGVRRVRKAVRRNPQR